MLSEFVAIDFYVPIDLLQCLVVVVASRMAVSQQGTDNRGLQALVVSATLQLGLDLEAQPKPQHNLAVTAQVTTPAAQSTLTIALRLPDVLRVSQKMIVLRR